jgi:hypothetical protein
MVLAGLGWVFLWSLGGLCWPSVGMGWVGLGVNVVTG